MSRICPLLIGLFLVLLAACGQPIETPTAIPAQNTPADQRVPNVPLSAAATPTVAIPRDIKPVSGKIEYLPGDPMTEKVSVQQAPVKSTSPLELHILTWGGDIPAIFANGGRTTKSGSIFAKEGLNVRIVRQDNLLLAVESVIRGDTPYLRATVGMAECALEALEQAGITVRPFFKISDSTGGDTVVERREEIHTIKDLAGHTIGMQWCGPHVEFVGKLLQDAGVNLNDVEIRWLRELTLPPYDTKGTIVDPKSAILADTTLDAVAVISPDMVALTSGTAESGESLANGSKLADTKFADTLIADLYFVRDDFYQQHPEQVEVLAHALLLATEQFTELYNNRQTRQAEWEQLLTMSADILLDNSAATASVEGLIQDMRLAGHTGNVRFFTGLNTNRTIETLHSEAQDTLIAFGLRSKKLPLEKIQWDYNALAVGLKDVSLTPIPKAHIDTAKAEQSLTQRQLKGNTKGQYFSFTVHFAANTAEFDRREYVEYYDALIALDDTYPGAFKLITGHADTYLYNKRVAEGESPQRLSLFREQLKNDSQRRAQAVLEDFLTYAKDLGRNVNEAAFFAIGVGIEDPVHPRPVAENTTTCTQCAANRRVVFEVVGLETEATTFN